METWPKGGGFIRILTIKNDQKYPDFRLIKLHVGDFVIFL